MQCTLESNQAAIDYRLRSAMSPCRSGKSAVNTAIQFSRARRATTKRSQHDQIAKQRMRFLDALNLSHANDYANPVAASELPFQKPVVGNSGSAFCSPAFLKLPGGVSHVSGATVIDIAISETVIRVFGEHFSFCLYAFGSAVL